MGQTAFHNLVGKRGIFRSAALYERYCAAQDVHVPAQNAVYIVVGCKACGTSQSHAVQVGVERRWLLNSAVYLQSFERIVIFGVFHICGALLYVLLGLFIFK